MNQLSDAELWQSVIQGELAAFEEVVAKYQGTVVAVAFSRCGDFSTSQDIAQETFLAAWSSRDQLREPDKLLGWLCSIARRLAAGAYRSKAAHPEVSMSDAYDTFHEQAPPIESLISREEETLVWNAIAELPENYREPLVLFYQEAHSVQEIAHSLDISLDAAKQRLSRGREMIRSSMLSTVEDVLSKARPSKALTMRIMAAVAGFSAGSAVGSKAIASGVASTIAGSVAGKAMFGTAGGATAGVLGGFLGAAGGLLGAYAGTKIPALTAPTMTERRFIEKAGKITMAVSLIYTAFIVALSFAIAVRLLSTAGFLWTFGVVQILFFASIFGQAYIVQKQIKKIRATVRESDDPNPSQLRGWVNQQRKTYIGRTYQSQSRFLGLPWIDIQVSNGLGDTMPQPKTARGWIAIGDRAHGILLGIGGTARGLIAFGGVAIGGVSIGGLSLGLIGIGGAGLGAIAIGGLAIGYQAFGGGAIGWDACGGGALGWHSAAGGGAVAKHAAFGGGAYASDYAVGGAAIAASFNTPEAEQVIQRETYRWLLEAQAKHPSGFWIVFLGAMLIYTVLLLCMMKIMYVKVEKQK